MWCVPPVHKFIHSSPLDSSKIDVEYTAKETGMPWRQKKGVACKLCSIMNNKLYVKPVSFMTVSCMHFICFI